jgi:hypothetical protein
MGRRGTTEEKARIFARIPGLVESLDRSNFMGGLAISPDALDAGPIATCIEHTVPLRRSEVCQYRFGSFVFATISTPEFLQEETERSGFVHFLRFLCYLL